MAVLVLVGVGLWVGSKALTVKSELEAARPLLVSVKDKVLSGDAGAAGDDAEKLSNHAAAAREATSDPVWRFVELLPWVGPNLVAVRTVTESVDEVIEDAVYPAVRLGDTLSPDLFKPVNGALDLAKIESLVPVLDRAGSAVANANVSVSAIDTGSLIPPVAGAVTEIRDLISQVEPAISAARQVAPLVPSFLGADRPQNYLLIFENSAEVRPLGGIAGAQILLTADAGRIAIAQQTSGRDFEFESEAFADSQVPREARELFLVPFGVQSQNNTLTPRVEVAAQLTRAMWESQRGVTADTVIFIDPVALSYVLRATGPLTLVDGTQLTADNSIDVLLNGVYKKFKDPDEQDAYFASAASQLFDTVMSGGVDLPSLIKAVETGGAEGRILASSVNPSMQAVVAKVGLQGRMPQESDSVRQIGVYMSDYLGSKMDYYLRTDVQVGQAQCGDGSRRLRVQVTATNVLDPSEVAELPDYITAGPKNSFGIPVGDLRIFTYVYAPVGSTIASITGTTSQSDAFIGTDRDYPVARGVIQVPPGGTQASTVDVDITGLSEKDVHALVTPTLFQTDVRQLEFTC
jgi:hypothetical protein